jgi:hypothetical protein
MFVTKAVDVSGDACTEPKLQGPDIDDVVSV